MPKPKKFTVAIDVRVPHEFKDAIEDVSRQRFLTPSQYVRDAIKLKLEHDGVCPKPAA
jgi:hypothetical protein